ncbi:OmpA family protein [Paenibacillus sp. N1-5-1-14]|uniref:flagellar motor protein MotB n=1 Tax=Paenibacillus radicibacter TaxID=2972488 RepID=UPI002159868B|nr:flagellar motor protein MotB [Paenibacillus radicibacter]MCR8644997.1 OmpA family protein [Paenibacillus radicibacter]
MRRNKKKAEEHVNHERWLITYADLITLLLVFFIIMYAMSKVDVSKYDVLASALQHQFKQAETFLPKNNGIAGKMSNTNSNQDQKQTDQMDQKNDKDKAEHEKKEKELQEFKNKIDTYISEHQLDALINVADTKRGIAITLDDVFLFNSGQAVLKPPAFDILNKLATLLPGLKNKVSIEGHTDSVPVATGSVFRDNWGLSSERALNVLRYLTQKNNLNPTQFVATGYADTVPKTDNDTAENRSKNRRVEIIILR